MPKKTQNILYVLDAFPLSNIKKWKQKQLAIESYCWEHYSYFAHQRSLISNELKAALVKNCKELNFSNWQRAVDYRHCLQPLSTKGSILNSPGGRFNIGDIDQIKFPRFGGLYVAEDRETAIREKFGLESKKEHGGLTTEELNLTSMRSLSILSLKGELINVLDLCDINSLNDFFLLIKNIPLPKSFIHRAKLLGILPMLPVKDLKELINSILSDDWRIMAMQVDIPSNSQVLGQLAHAAGIEAILYPSAKAQKKCLVIFPENLVGTSYVEIEDEAPAEASCYRIDAQTY